MSVCEPLPSLLPPTPGPELWQILPEGCSNSLEGTAPCANLDFHNQNHKPFSDPSSAFWPCYMLFCFHRADILELLCVSIHEAKNLPPWHSQCFISPGSVLQHLIYSSFMCSVASYIKNGELKAMGFVLTGSFSISKQIILEFELKFSPLPGGNTNFFSSWWKASKLQFAEFKLRCFRRVLIWSYFACNFPILHAL